MGMIGGHSITAWALFHLIVIVCLALDLGVIKRKARLMEVRETVFWNVIWTALGLGFGAAVAYAYGRQSGFEYVTGYVVERALSVDNIFVFVIIFRYFSVPARHQYRALLWGILLALVMRAAFIVAGVAIVSLFHWMLYIFGAFLVYTGAHLLFQKEEPPHPERNPLVRLAKRFFPIETQPQGERLFVRRSGRLHATPLLLVLIVLATTDFVFALDSLPAIFGVTLDPFIIYSSNVFAILGMRVLYFLLAAMLPHFRFLKHGLSAVLSFIGTRMLLDHYVKIPTSGALLVVCAILGIAVAASLLPPGRKKGSV